MKLENRQTQEIIKQGYIYTLVKLNRQQKKERTRNNIPLPCYMGYKGLALHSCIKFPTI